jgi:tetratricopeptide (TPR) repeat protein
VKPDSVIRAPQQTFSRTLNKVPVFLKLSIRRALCFALLVGAQHVAPHFTGQLTASAQSPSKSAPQSKSQKVSNPLNDYLDDAQHAIDTNNFEAAIPPLQKFLAEKPDVAYAHFQLAYVYTALKRADEARTEYQQAIALDPKMSEAYLNLGTLLLINDPPSAVAPLRKAVELLPAQTRPRFLLGVALERTGDLSGAAESFEGASHLDPHDLETLAHLADIYLSLKRPTDAEAKFREILTIQKDNASALLGLAKCLDAEKKPEAADAYRNYLAAHPENTEARARLVHLLLDQQQYEAAIAELDRADAGAQPSLDSLRLRADIQIGQKKWDDAVATLLRAIALAPRDAQLHGGLGRIYLQKRDFPSAEKELRAAIQIDGNNIVYWKDLSSTYYLGGNYPAAINALDIVAKVESPGPGTWFIRALCLDKLNQYQPALAAYQKFLELDKEKDPNQVWQAQQRSKVLRRKLQEKR